MSRNSNSSVDLDATAVVERPQRRRNFLMEFVALAVGATVSLVPLAVGLVSFLNPLRKSVKAKQRPVGSDDDGYYKVASLEALSAAPQAFKIIADRKDAWNTFPDQAIGAVFLQRLASEEVRAFNVLCPHLGCAVDYRPDKGDYLCPCHNSAFALDGTRSPSSPSARDLDSLPCKVVDGAVWVKYQEFKGSTAKKEPV
ncbi:MAG: ubiquinol-cytochrome c reductase iron-sulfur subunit [Planctomycetaceae bacterium]